jgi:hypothetical protein
MAFGSARGLLVAGANPTAYNGEQIVTAVTANTFSFAVAGSPASPATGTIVAKTAPAAWTKAFSGTNLAAYKSAAVSATGCLLRVDDSAAQSSVLRGYESMSDVNTGSGPFPTPAQLGGGIVLRKSDASSAASRPWLLFADDRLFYLFNAWPSGSLLAGQHEAQVFGDPVT